MMKDTRNARIKIIAVLAMAALTVVYVYFVAPHFLSNIDSMRAENKQIEYDLDELQEAGKDSVSLRNDIELSRSQLEGFEKRTEVGEKNYDLDIAAKAKRSNVEISEIAVEDRSAVSKQDKSGKILYLQPVTVSFTGNFADGIKFIRSLEESDTGIYEIRDFLYTKGSDSDEKSWMVSIDVYYYGKEENQ